MKVAELLTESKPVFNDDELSKKDERRFRKALKKYSGKNADKETKAIDTAIANLRSTIEKKKK